MIRTREALALSAGLLAPAAIAAPIPIQNPSFEENVVPDGNYQAVANIPGWTLYDPDNVFIPGVNVLGVVCPIGSGYYTPDEAADGRNFGFVFLLQPGGGPMGMEQALGVDLQPRTTYTLTLAIGDIARAPGVPPNPPDEFPIDGFPGYAVQLLAGGRVLVEDANSLDALLDDGEYAYTTLTHTTGAAVDLGLELSIRLLNLNGPEGVEANFDDLSLDASPACAADIDGDGLVNFADLNALLGSFNQTGPGLPGDLDGDEDVDFADLNALLDEFNTECG